MKGLLYIDVKQPESGPPDFQVMMIIPRHFLVTIVAFEPGCGTSLLRVPLRSESRFPSRKIVGLMVQIPSPRHRIEKGESRILRTHHTDQILRVFQRWFWNYASFCCHTCMPANLGEKPVEKTRPALLRHMHVYGTVAMELHDSAWSARWSGGVHLAAGAGGSWEAFLGSANWKMEMWDLQFCWWMYRSNVWKRKVWLSRKIMWILG